MKAAGEAVELSEFMTVNSEGVPRPDERYQGWYYRPWNRDQAWEYFRFTSSGALEVHHFCDDGCSGTSSLGKPNFCCSSVTAGGEPCNGGNTLILNTFDLHLAVICRLILGVKLKFNNEI